MTRDRRKSLLTVALCMFLVLVALVIFVLAQEAQASAGFITTPIGSVPVGVQQPVLTWRMARVDMDVVKDLRTPRLVFRPVVTPAALKSPTRLPDALSGSPMALGQQMAAERGWVGSQWTALKQLWSEESGWSPSATNGSSGACGIPQRHPCNGLSSQSVKAQIAWGLNYISQRYGSPASALAAKHAKGWY